jgi:RNA polymerase sigma-70 factor (ECF subfamily)
LGGLRSRAALDQLPDDEREVVRLAHYVGMTHSEIAAKLGLPLGTVKSRSSRAHRRLAGLLAHLVEAAR